MNFEEFKERFQKVPVAEYPNRVREAMPQPIVSVRITTYQHADYIQESIESVLMQETDFPVEILLGDDESSDGTREICIEYAEKYPERIRLMLHRRENNIHLHGRPTHLFQYAYNTFSLRGKYIAGVSGDDYWTDPKKLQKQVNFLEANSEYVVSFHDAKIVNSSGNLIEKSKLPNSHKRDFSKKELKAGAFLLSLSLCFRNVLDGFPHEYFKVLNEDTFLISLLGQHGKGKYQGDITPAVYRTHAGGIWSKSDQLYRHDAAAATYLSLAKYHKRKRNFKTSESFKEAHKRRLRKVLHCYISTREPGEFFKTFVELSVWYVRDFDLASQYSLLREIIGRLLSPIFKRA